MFVTTAELAAYLGRADSPTLVNQLDQAEAMIAAYLETQSLRERTVTEEHVVLYPLDADELLVTRDGPIQSVTSLTQIFSTTDDEEIAVSELIVKPWGIKRIGSTESDQGLAKGRYSIVFTAGWDYNAEANAPDRMPFRMREALKGIAGEIVVRPNRNMQSERMGDYSYTIGAGEGENSFGLSKYSRSQLDYWRHGSL